MQLSAVRTLLPSVFVDQVKQYSLSRREVFSKNKLSDCLLACVSALRSLVGEQRARENGGLSRKGKERANFLKNLTKGNRGCII